MYFKCLKTEDGGDLLMRFFSPIYPSVIAIIKASLPLRRSQRVTEEEKLRSMRHRLRYRQSYTPAGVIRAAKVILFSSARFVRANFSEEYDRLPYQPLVIRTTRSP